MHCYKIFRQPLSICVHFFWREDSYSMKRCCPILLSYTRRATVRVKAVRRLVLLLRLLPRNMPVLSVQCGDGQCGGSRQPPRRQAIARHVDDVQGQINGLTSRPAPAPCPLLRLLSPYHSGSHPLRNSESTVLDNEVIPFCL